MSQEDVKLREERRKEKRTKTKGGSSIWKKRDSKT
jgi:hypothetical protein